jgi:hypothetical protein
VLGTLVYVWREWSSAKVLVWEADELRLEILEIARRSGVRL